MRQPYLMCLGHGGEHVLTVDEYGHEHGVVRGVRVSPVGVVVQVGVALVHASKSFSWSSSWKALRFRAARGTSWTIAITGTDALRASASGGTSRVAAGPF